MAYLKSEKHKKVNASVCADLTSPDSDDGSEKDCVNIRNAKTKPPNCLSPDRKTRNIKVKENILRKKKEPEIKNKKKLKTEESETTPSQDPHFFESPRNANFPSTAYTDYPGVHTCNMYYDVPPSPANFERHYYLGPHSHVQGRIQPWAMNPCFPSQFHHENPDLGSQSPYKYLNEFIINNAALATPPVVSDPLVNMPPTHQLGSETEQLSRYYSVLELPRPRNTYERYYYDINAGMPDNFPQGINHQNYSPGNSYFRMEQNMRPTIQNQPRFQPTQMPPADINIQNVYPQPIDARNIPQNQQLDVPDRVSKHRDKSSTKHRTSSPKNKIKKVSDGCSTDPVVAAGALIVRDQISKYKTFGAETESDKFECSKSTSVKAQIKQNKKNQGMCTVNKKSFTQGIGCPSKETLSANVCLVRSDNLPKYHSSLKEVIKSRDNLGCPSKLYIGFGEDNRNLSKPEKHSQAYQEILDIIKREFGDNNTEMVDVIFNMIYGKNCQIIVQNGVKLDDDKRGKRIFKTKKKNQGICASDKQNPNLKVAKSEKHKGKHVKRSRSKSISRPVTPASIKSKIEETRKKLHKTVNSGMGIDHETLQMEYNAIVNEAQEELDDDSISSEKKIFGNGFDKLDSEYCNEMQMNAILKRVLESQGIEMPIITLYKRSQENKDQECTKLDQEYSRFIDNYGKAEKSSPTLSFTRKDEILLDLNPDKLKRLLRSENGLKEEIIIDMDCAREKADPKSKKRGDNPINKYKKIELAENAKTQKNIAFPQSLNFNINTAEIEEAILKNQNQSMSKTELYEEAIFDAISEQMSKYINKSTFDTIPNEDIYFDGLKNQNLDIIQETKVENELNWSNESINTNNSDDNSEIIRPFAKIGPPPKKVSVGVENKQPFGVENNQPFGFENKQPFGFENKQPFGIENKQPFGFENKQPTAVEPKTEEITDQSDDCVELLEDVKKLFDKLEVTKQFLNDSQKKINKPLKKINRPRTPISQKDKKIPKRRITNRSPPLESKKNKKHPPHVIEDILNLLCYEKPIEESEVSEVQEPCEEFAIEEITESKLLVAEEGSAEITSAASCNEGFVITEETSEHKSDTSTTSAKRHLQQITSNYVFLEKPDLMNNFETMILNELMNELQFKSESNTVSRGVSTQFD